MSGNSVKHLNDASFDDAAASGITLVDFWAPWCGPCRMQSPILDMIAQKVGESATIAKVDVDQAPNVAARFGVRSIPTLVVLKDGQVAQQFVGVQQESTLLKALQKAEAG